MGPAAEPLMLNDVLTEAAQLSQDERRARVLECVGANGRHDPDALPFCHDPSADTLIRYCDRCWSVIDRHGRTWSWAPRSA